MVHLITTLQKDR